MVAIPQKSATVILLRQKSPSGFEAFLLRRHEKSRFMAGNYVYPGGRVDQDDTEGRIVPCCRGLSPDEAQERLANGLSREESFAHWVAAARELFEEAGVLLAFDSEGIPFRIRKRTDAERFSGYRVSLQKGQLSLEEILRRERLFLALDQLLYFAHWITPEARSERFDTRFFLARHPEGQEALHDQQETTDGRWLTPREALEKNLTGEVILSPPTLKTLEDLSRFDDMEAALHNLPGRKIDPVLPVLTKVAGETFILFPWDPEYKLFRDGRPPEKIDHGRPSTSEDRTTRVVLREGRWLPFCRRPERP